ncbi:hypothetical protein AHiyo8_59290 [Arthrobacter sp. Hiyo8]|uniref:hypothetical protein n=1 Tax=Arthrobacter sp. Hiyo1 TaxID=1588020 RepID=UPI00068381A1|nr:hypothetical protein [Arthrobacter sp. Hiyo1]BAS17626.1 hypothetical protein AHiyo8_59290 [Arthrobacter sp. Hiyo8]GAP57984.1 hypothetical protein AHiyo1_09460 [Arthrobacter sp. Hiyo1]
MSRYTQALPAQTAAGATSTTYVGTAETTNGDVTNRVTVTLTPPAGFSTVTGVATNNVTFNVRQLRAGSSLGTIASLQLAVGANLVAETPITVPVTAPLAVQGNDVFDVQMVQNGTGLAVGAGVFVQVQVN